MLLRLAALLTLATSVYFLQRAAEPIFEQNARVRQWPAVDATVEVTAPGAEPAGETDRAGDGRHRVVYRHEVNGVLYRNTALDPQADDWVPAGPSPATEGRGSYARRAHYDPQRPAKLFFPKPFGFRDYLPVFIWAPLFAVGFGGLMLRKPGRAVTSPADSATKGWHRLRPKHSVRHRASGAWGVAVVCNLLLAAAAYDYFTGEPRARGRVSDVLVCLAMLPGVATLGLAVYYTRTARRVGEPAVRVDAARVRPGERLAVKVELPLKQDLDLERVVVSLICVRTALASSRGLPGRRETPVYEDRAERDLARRSAGAGTRVAFEQRFRVPPDAEPSSASHVAFRGPWVDWYVEVRFHLDNGPDYRGRFPVTVEAG